MKVKNKKYYTWFGKIISVNKNTLEDDTKIANQLVFNLNPHLFINRFKYTPIIKIKKNIDTKQIETDTKYPFWLVLGKSSEFFNYENYWGHGVPENCLLYILENNKFNFIDESKMIYTFLSHKIFINETDPSFLTEVVQYLYKEHRTVEPDYLFKVIQPFLKEFFNTKKNLFNSIQSESTEAFNFFESLIENQNIKKELIVTLKNTLKIIL